MGRALPGPPRKGTPQTGHRATVSSVGRQKAAEHQHNSARLTRYILTNLMKLFAKVLCLVLLLPVCLAVPSQAPTQDEVRRFQEIQSKRNRGERLTPEELEFAQRLMARRREQYAQEHPQRDSTGLIPLTDMGQETYQGEGGGLYAGGANSPPSAHLNAGLGLARGIVPPDQQGQPSRDGKIVLLSVGMSNTTMELQAVPLQAGEKRSPECSWTS